MYWLLTLELWRTFFVTLYKSTQSSSALSQKFAMNRCYWFIGTGIYSCQCVKNVLFLNKARLCFWLTSCPSSFFCIRDYEVALWPAVANQTYTPHYLPQEGDWNNWYVDEQASIKYPPNKIAQKHTCTPAHMNKPILELMCSQHWHSDFP